MSRKTLTESDCREWNLNKLTFVIRMCSDQMRSAMNATSQLPRGEPIDVDD